MCYLGFVCHPTNLFIIYKRNNISLSTFFSFLFQFVDVVCLFLFMFVSLQEDESTDSLDSSLTNIEEVCLILTSSRYLSTIYIIYIKTQMCKF